MFLGDRVPTKQATQRLCAQSTVQVAIGVFMHVQQLRRSRIVPSKSKMSLQEGSREPPCAASKSACAIVTIRSNCYRSACLHRPCKELSHTFALLLTVPLTIGACASRIGFLHIVKARIQRNMTRFAYLSKRISPSYVALTALTYPQKQVLAT